MRWAYYKAKGERIIEINHNLRRHKQTARKKLLSDQGLERQKHRPTDVEATFGLIKNNKGFKRLMFRGKRKVEIETG